MSDSEDCSCSECNEISHPHKSRLNKIKKYNSKTMSYVISTLEEILEKFESLDKRMSDLEKKVKKISTS